jgi:hypothetical protein
MRNEVVAAVMILLVIASAGAGYFVGTFSERTTTSVSTITLPAIQVNSNVFVMNVSGSSYYANDISSDIVVQNPGYAYFRNASVTFDGVRFETICPRGYSGCPVPSENSTNQTVTQVLLGVYKFNMTFPDMTTETTQGFIGDATYTFALSNHISPRAGMLVENVEYNYHVYLLVSVPSYCGPFGCDISTTTVKSEQTP